MSEAQQAFSQVLDAEDGYDQPQMQRVFDDDRFPPRLGIPQVALRLAREAGGRLVPWAGEGPPCWQSSEERVSVPRYQWCLPSLGELTLVGLRRPQEQGIQGIGRRYRTAAGLKLALLLAVLCSGQVSGTGTFTFDPTKDSLAEGAETVILAGSATGLTAGTATAAIDTEPEQRVDITVSVKGRDPKEAVGFEAVPEFDVSILAGTRSAPGTFTLTPSEDKLAAPDRYPTVNGAASLPDMPVTGATSRLVDNDRSGPEPYREVPAIAIWTDELGYRGDEVIRLYGDIDSQGDDREYTVFFYRENIETGERLYLAPGTGTAELREEVVDYYGRGADTRLAFRLRRLEKELLWEGRVPEPGLWHFVAELRSPGTTQVLRRAYAKFVVARNGFRLLNRPGIERHVATDTRWSNDWIHNLGHRLVVESGATLTIEAGTLIRAKGRDTAIIVEEGARIVAQGRREAPVVMTCAQPVGKRLPGCWGGLAVYGNAPAGNGQGDADDRPPEGRSEPAGQDRSSELRYLRVEFAGAGSEAPSSALAFHRVDDGMVIDHVQVHASLGDGIAFHGGTAHCGYCVASEVRGNSVSWGLGWQGSAQHLYVQQGGSGGAGVRGEAEGGAGDGRAPLLYNLTLVGGYNIGLIGGAPGRRRSIGPGILLDGGAAVTARNVAVIGFAGYAIDTRGESVAHFESGRSSLGSVITNTNATSRGGSSPVSPMIASQVEYIYNNPDFLNIRYEPNPDPRPRSGSVALRLGNAAVPPAAGKMSRAAQYVGAFGKRNWLEEWTFFGGEGFYDATVE